VDGGKGVGGKEGESVVLLHEVDLMARGAKRSHKIVFVGLARLYSLRRGKWCVCDGVEEEEGEGGKEMAWGKARRC